MNEEREKGRTHLSVMYNEWMERSERREGRKRKSDESNERDEKMIMLEKRRKGGEDGGIEKGQRKKELIPSRLLPTLTR